MFMTAVGPVVLFCMRCMCGMWYVWFTWSLIHKSVFSTLQYFNAEVVYILIHCVFDSSIAGKCLKAVDEKQEINLLWPYTAAT